MCVTAQWVEAVGVTAAAGIAAFAYYHQVLQSRIMLWRDLQKEWDHEFARERKRSVGAYRSYGKLMHTDVQAIMDFFETLASLYFKHGVDRDLTKETFEYYFAGYFVAAKEWMDIQRKSDDGFYRKVFELAAEWASERSMPTKSDLSDFFNEESRFHRTMGEQIAGEQ